MFVRCRLAEARKADGNKAYQAGRYEEAVAFYSKAVYHNPNDAVYYSNKSAALMMIQRYQEALDDCTQAIKLDDTYMKVGTGSPSLRTLVGGFDSMKVGTGSPSLRNSSGWV